MSQKHNINSIVFGLISLVSLAIPSASAANVVINGGFESPSVIGQPNPSITGWAMASDSNASGFIIQNASEGPAYEASQYLKMDTTATTSIYQDLSTSIGTIYSLSFAYSGRAGIAENKLRITMGNTVLDNLLVNSSAIGSTAWMTYSYLFTATSSLTRLKFDNLQASSSNAGGMLDAVSVTNSLPEPTALALLGGSLLVLHFQTRDKAA